MLIEDIWKVIKDYGTSSLRDRLSSTAVARLPNSFYVKILDFLHQLNNVNPSHELTLDEAYDFVKCVFTTETDKLYEIEKNLYDNIASIIPWHWSAAARILLKNNMMNEKFWLLCSQEGDRGLSYAEILPELKALCTTDKCVIDFLKKSNFSFIGFVQLAGLTEDTLRQSILPHRNISTLTKDNLRQSLLLHRNLFGIVLFTYKAQDILEEILKKPDAEEKILNQMITRINAMGPEKYEAMRHWNYEDLHNFAFQAPGGPGMYTIQLPGGPSEIKPEPSRRVG